MNSVVDFHTHILPQIDDGSASVAESLGMLRAEGAQGVGRVVATPHFYAHTDGLKPFLQRRAAAVERLREAMEGQTDLPEICVGAEVHYFPGIGDTDILSELAIDHGRSVLIEMPVAPWTERMYRDLQNVHDNLGLTPIVAHVDRYISPARTHGIPERLMELDVLVQANAGFFRRFFTKRMALRMLERGQIHLLGSDCHNMTSRPVNIGQAVDLIGKELGQHAIARIHACQWQALSRQMD